jgi:uncharacterized protein YhfF
MWSAFIAAYPENAGTPYSAWHFSDNAADADNLVELVLSGQKRATAGPLWCYEEEDEPLPRVGDLSLITDFDGLARCVIRTTSVEIVAFDKVSERFAATEGEGDGSLEYWRRVHWDAFTRHLAEIDRIPELAMPVVCECFDVVFPTELGESQP